MEIIKNKVEDDIILSNHELSDKEIIRAYSVLVKKLKKQIFDLKEENENKSQLGLALYTALSKELEKQGLADDIPSVIDQLVGKNCGEYTDMYNEYKNQKQELAYYRKALELACESFTQFMRENGCEDYDFKEVCLNKAKEKINGV